MVDSPLPEIETRPTSDLPKKGNFGIALEPEAVKISGYALLIGLIGGLVAEGLLQLIYFFTNLFFYGKFSFAITSPAHHHLGLWVIAIPPLGGLIVGLMVHFWEPTLKGHGIPEAMEAVLFSHSRMRLRVAFLKPLATALAIGTGGPFGAEGPIIQTGAACGSLFGQFVGLSPYYRRVLLASGAAAGMAATFAAPLAGVLVAVELLLFEFRAFSAPVAILSSAVLSTSGVFFALLLTQTTFNVSSFIGLIMVVGIVAKNGILLLDANKKYRAEGMSMEEAIVHAGRRRLRPIVMTALAAVAGMLPLALAIGAGSEMLKPLAIAVIGGILISMISFLALFPLLAWGAWGLELNGDPTLERTVRSGSDST